MNLGVLRGLHYASKYLKEDIISRGNKNDSLHIVLRGEVGLFSAYKKPTQKLIGKYCSGDFFGEYALFSEQGMPYSAVALTDVITISVNRRNAADFVNEEPGLALELMQALAQRAAQIDAELINRSGSSFVELHPPMSAVPVQEKPSSSPAISRSASPAVPAAKTNAELAEPPEHLVFPLFPEGHKEYTFEMDTTDTVHLMEKSYVCPVCKKSFKGLRVKPSQLLIERTDKDMRNHYKGVEPLHYDITTCPFCLFSALNEMFQKPDKPNAPPPPEFQNLDPSVFQLFAARRTPAAVFASYYLALICGPVYFMKHESATANLLLKLSRLYEDCGETALDLTTTQKALDAYLDVYMHLDLTPPQEQQLCIITAELYMKLGDVKNAKSYFFRTKTMEPAAPRLTDQAEKRLMDIQLMEIEEEKSAKEAEAAEGGKKKK